MLTFSIILHKKPDDTRSPQELLKEAIGSFSDAINLFDIINHIKIWRESIDARRKNLIWLEYQIIFQADPNHPLIKKALSEQRINIFKRGDISRKDQDADLNFQEGSKVDKHPVIIGFGPSGMFLALQLARLGLEPIVFEQGEPVEERWKSVQALWEKGELNPQSNMHFGEGGAGAFSDGKLTTGKSGPIHQLILEEFHRFGGREDILYRAKPHLGTDYVQIIVRNIRQEILRLGGQVLFGHRLERLYLREGKVAGAVINGQDYPLGQIFLCPGNSSRELFKMLFENGVAMEPKAMAVGVRVEHERDFIDALQYGQWKVYLPAADYKLTARSGNRGVYSFCMCPGGFVVCTSTEPKGLVTNGMSFSHRDAPYSNSAVVVSVSPADYPSTHPLAGIEFQRALEQRAYLSSFSSATPFTAPIQRCSDFMAGRISSHPLPKTSYKPGVAPVDYNSLLPPFISLALKEGLSQFEKKMPGFIKHGVLVGVETRTSSPVRILRNEHYESVNTRGLYLLGEGAGYAGGIMTCSVDAYRFSLRKFDK